MKKTLSYFLIFISLYASGQELSDELQAQIKLARQEHQIPAIAVSLITPDSIYAFVGGKSQLGKKEKIEQDAKFHLGSNTKAITAFIAMRLVEENEIGLDTRFFNLFPELMETSRINYEDITLGDLLSHNAEIPPYTSGIELFKFQELKGSASENRYAFAKSVLTDEPAKQGTYSNAGYVLATLMLEKATSKTYKQLMTATMNELDLDFFVGFPNQENPDFPWGHWVENGSLTALEPGQEYKLANYMSSAGDISLNLADYSTFIQLNLQGLTGTSNYLQSGNYDILHFGQTPYAYGWGNMIQNENRISYHDGSAGTYYCHTLMMPDQKMAIVIMTNTATEEAVQAIYELRKWMVNHPSQSKK